MDTKKAVFELETIVTIIEEKVKRGAVIQSTLTDGRYFGMDKAEMEEDNAFKIRYDYEEAGIKADIVLDYLNDMKELCAQAAEIVNGLMEDKRQSAA